MNRIEIVNSKCSWQEVVSRLGQDGVAAAAWQVIPNEEAQSLAPYIAAGFTQVGHDRANSVYFADPSRIPEPVIDAAYDLALECRRFPLDPAKRLNTGKNKPGVFGISHAVTGLHADIWSQDRKPISPPLKSLYVAAGAIRAYFRSIPLDMIRPGEHVGYPDDWDVEDSAADNKLVIREEEKVHFPFIDAPAGMILSFPSSGSFERGIQPSAHQIETIGDEPRYTISISDVHFRAS